jgi:biotin carboxylase
MHNYDHLVRALGYFTHRYGKIDRLDSQNEYWLETEAQLRIDFNIDGLKTPQMAQIKRKSQMKKVYQKVGIEVARGRIVRKPIDAQTLIAETGFPVVAKPDIGVGAAKTYKIRDEAELQAFFTDKPQVDYFMEEFIQGEIVSFDGLADHAGDLVFSTAHSFSSGVMEAVNQDSDLYYYSYREIPADLAAVGERTLQAFNVRGRFFHFEYFRTPEGRLVALEVNMRPPGGLTTDMFNYANDIDVYAAWATLMVEGTVSLTAERPYHVAYVGRKNTRQYAHSHEAVLAECGDYLCHHQPIEGVFAAAIGNYGYLLRSPDLLDVIQWAEFIQQVA